MKRLTFKDEWVGKIVSGHKTATCRTTDRKLCVGDIVAAVARQGQVPAFLVGTKDAFATLRITAVTSVVFGEYTENHALKCGFQSLEQAREWYRQTKLAGEDHQVFIYEFEVVPA
jgi:hypothetical protein